MKRLLTILLLIVSANVFGQLQPQPSGTLTPLTTNQAYFRASDSTYYFYNGTNYLWNYFLNKQQADKLYTPINSPAITPFSLSTGYGLVGSSFNGSVARTWTADTASVDGLVSKSRLATNLGGYVPKSRTITINGATRDLSANRTWNVGTVTSVGTGYGLLGGAITSSGTLSVDTSAIATKSYTNKYVPYDNATKNVNLGEFGIRAGYALLDTTPTNTPTTRGTIYWDTARSTAALIMNGTTQEIGQDSYFYVKNSTGSPIAKGTAVRFAGTDGGSGHLLIAPFLANGTYPSSYFMGVTAEAIANGGFGQVMNFGELKGVNTNAYVDGDLLYASTSSAGGFQTTAPVAPNNIVLIAAVVNAANNGTIIVRPTYGSNINDDEGVKITNPLAGDVLQYKSSGLWENEPLDSAGIVPTSRTITINGTTQNLSANRTWNVGTVTSVGATAGTGISVTGSPITSSGNITITNTAPDQTVVLTAGTGISTSGTYPNFTITNTSPSPSGLQDSLTKKANRTFDNVASGAIAQIKVAGLQDSLNTRSKRSSTQANALFFVDTAESLPNGGEINNILRSDGVTVDQWYRLINDTNIYHRTANNALLNNWGASTLCTGISGYFPTVFQVDSTYYMFLNPTDYTTSKKVLLYSSTDKINWTVMNGGNSVITNTGVDTDWFNTLYNTGVAVVQDTLHILIEGTALTGTYSGNAWLGYAKAPLSNPNFTLSPTPITKGGNASLVYAEDKNSLVALYGEIFPDYATGEWRLRAATADLSADLTKSGGWVISDTYWPELDGVADPDLIFTPGKTHPSLFSYNVNQLTGMQAYSDVVHDANSLYNSITNISSTGKKVVFDQVTADLIGNASTVTNGVYTVGDQIIGGLKTFDVIGASSILPNSSSSNIGASGNRFNTLFSKNANIADTLIVERILPEVINTSNTGTGDVTTSTDFAPNADYQNSVFGRNSTRYGGFTWNNLAGDFNIQTYANSFPIVIAGSAVKFSTLAGTGTRMTVSLPDGTQSTQPIPTGGGGGSVTGVAIASANGFGGSSDGATVVPTLTLTTSVNGILYGNGTGVSAAVAGNFPTLPYLPLAGGNMTGALISTSTGAFSSGTFSDGTQGLVVRPYTGTSGYGAIYPVGVTPDNNNYGFLSTATQSVINGSTQSDMAVGGVAKLTATSSSVTASVPLSATNLSGTNTGDQTITLTGAVTGSGTGSFATTLSSGVDATKIADGTVTSAEFQYINTLSSNAQNQLDAKAQLNSPTFTGTPSLPTGTIAVTQTQGDNSTKIATTAYVDGSLTSKTNRILKDWYTDANNVTTSETDLYDYTVPSNTLINNGDKLYFEIGGSYSGTANTKEIKLTFGSTGFIFGSTTSAGGNWTVKGFLVKTGATSYRIVASNTDDAPDKISTYSNTGSVTNYTGTNIFKISATGGASADITAKSGYLEFKPAAP